MEHKKENIRATIYTIISVVIVFLLLLIHMKLKQQDSEEGILVDFGNSVVGTGTQEPAPSVENPASKPKSPAVSEPVKSQPQTSEDVKEDVQTQDFDEAPVVESGKRKQETEEELAKKAEELRKQKEAEEAERKRKAEEDAERKRQEEIERKKKEEAERIQQEKDRKAAEISKIGQNAFGGAGNANTSGEGQTGDAGNQGSSNGAPNTGTYTGSGLGTSGSGFDLTGRSLNGSLPQPEYNVQEQGIVVVSIEVDRSGHVISATFSQKGSTTLNSALVQAAVKAAKEARFNDNPTAPVKQTGTITYHFRLD